MLKFTFAAVVLAATAWTHAADIRFFVSPTGSDANPGTRERPFASIIRGRDAVRQARKRAGADGLPARVEVMPGTYRLAAPLVFGPEDGNCTYSCFEAAGAIISGGRRIAGFEEGEDGRWRAGVADVAAGKWHFNELFVNGQRRPRARSPNDGYFRIVRAGADERTSFTFKPGDLKPYANLNDAEIVFLHDWSTSRVRIAEVNVKASVVRTVDPIGANANHYRISHFEPHPRYFVENALELLDSPGEWHLGRRTGVLTYWPMPGEVRSRSEVIAPVLENLVTAAGDPQSGRLVKRLRFEGLAFEHCALPRPAHGYAEAQACFFDERGETGEGEFMRNRMPAALEFGPGANGIVLSNCRIERVGGTGVSMAVDCHASIVERCTVRDVGGNGVMIGGAGVDDRAEGNAVRHSRISRCGQTFPGAVGVWAGIAAGTRVEHNEIFDLPYTGVSVGWSWNTKPTACGRNVVAKNHIHHVMQVLSDGGGVYTLGCQPGTIIKGNLIHDVPPNAGRAESNGMFIDEGSSQVLIEDNVIYNTARSPIRFHRATGNTVRGNTLVCAKGVPAFRYNSTDPQSMRYEANREVAAEGFRATRAGEIGAGPTTRSD